MIIKKPLLHMKGKKLCDNKLYKNQKNIVFVTDYNVNTLNHCLFKTSNVSLSLKFPVGS